MGTEEVVTKVRSDKLHKDSNSLGAKWSGIVDETPRQGRFPANLILTYPQDEFIIKEDLTKEQKSEVFQWLQENT